MTPNNARGATDYELSITVTEPVFAYLLIDNRSHGPNGNNSAGSTTDPVLGGVLQWVIDDGWVRMNTGIFPNDQADYLGHDENNNGTPNQNYAIFRNEFDTGTFSLESSELTNISFYGLVVTPVPEPSTFALAALGLAGLAGMPGAAARPPPVGIFIGFPNVNARPERSSAGGVAFSSEYPQKRNGGSGVPGVMVNLFMKPIAFSPIASR